MFTKCVNDYYLNTSIEPPEVVDAGPIKESSPRVPRLKIGLAILFVVVILVLSSSIIACYVILGQNKQILDQNINYVENQMKDVKKNITDVVKEIQNLNETIQKVDDKIEKVVNCSSIDCSCPVRVGAVNKGLLVAESTTLPP